MANLQERRDKDGKLISYSIRIYRGRGQDGKQLKPFTATFEVKPTWSEKSARKKAEAYAATLEDRVRNGLVSDNRQRFDEYCEYVLEQKARTGTKKTSIKGYRAMTKRIYAAIGHILLKDIRPDHLNRFYAQLEEDGSGIEKRTACSRKLADLLKEKKMTRKSLSEGAGVPINTVYSAVKGNPVPAKTAIALSKELGMDVNEVFDTQKKLHTLSANTVQHYHRLISMVLEQAVKEGLIPQNVSKRATLPKLQRKEVNHFQPEELLKICEALQGEPIKWRALVMVLMMSGCRRGEVLGLKWDKVDFAQNTILIDNNVLYVPKVGIYEDTPKTAKSRRLIALPPDTIELLRKYKAWQEEEIKALKGYYQDRGFLFAQEDGGPMHPDSVNTWLDRFSQRHGLPHINPHAFRHSMASVLYYNGMDSVSISARLGHAQVSTTSGALKFYAPVSGNLTLESVSGTMEVSNIAPQSLSLSSTSGSIHASQVVATTTWDIDSVSGQVTLTDCDASSLVINTISGGVKASLRSGKTFSTQTVSGDVEVPSDSSGGPCNISTVSGDITCTIQ